MAKEIKHAAADKRMTLDEVSAFVADAYSAGATGSEEVAAAVTFGGKLRHVAVNVTPQTTATET
ncbi:hypothetical protein ACIGW3_26230 [Streptomyces sp. NPDC053499]|uniref:hypothetical protein n=1 Tax=Streptomyces sp. NPDC053499 TaxID=3365707 RepID=UPI0037D1B71F